MRRNNEAIPTTVPLQRAIGPFRRSVPMPPHLEIVPPIGEPLEMRTLKFGVPDINIGYTLEEAVQYIATSPELEGKSVKIHPGARDSHREITWGGRNSWENVALITQRVGETIDHARGRRHSFVPKEYLLLIKIRDGNPKEVEEIELYTEYSPSIFISKVKKILNDIPPKWHY